MGGDETVTSGDAPSRDDGVAAELAPADFGRYELLGELARGGHGRILRARDTKLDRPVALKLPLRPESARRFAHEARLTARLQHPAIVPLYEAGLAPSGEPFYVMKLVEGRSLRQVVEARPAFADRLALLPSVIAVADAVAYAHAQRVIHRDLKPGNVLVGDYGETVVLDWGVAADLGQPQSGADIQGTPAYMAPEQAAGQPGDERVDVYALGALLYHVLAGKPPYAGADDVMARVREAAPTPIEQLAPQTPDDLAGLVQKAMARAPEKRHPSA
jgi:eukaryotic-like serine/threonine-protein kinase